MMRPRRTLLLRLPSDRARPLFLAAIRQLSTTLLALLLLFLSRLSLPLPSSPFSKALVATRNFFQLLTTFPTSACPLRQPLRQLPLRQPLWQMPLLATWHLLFAVLLRRLTFPPRSDPSTLFRKQLFRASSTRPLLPQLCRCSTFSTTTKILTLPRTFLSFSEAT